MKEVVKGEEEKKGERAKGNEKMLIVEPRWYSHSAHCTSPSGSQYV